MTKWIMAARVFFVLFVVPFSSDAVAQTEVRVATWNIAWLNERDGEGTIRRQNSDYSRLAKYAKRIKADIIAMQEVDGPGAARRVFDTNDYVFQFEQSNHAQRVGFAVRKEIPVQRHPDYEALSSGGTLRSGVDITVTLGDKQLRLLAVHLKCCCPTGSLASRGEHCPKLRRQVPELEGWIDARAEETIPFIVLGDFNRRFTTADEMWRELDDATPPNADLVGLVTGMRGKCWSDESTRAFIDNIVFDNRAARWLVANSAHQERYEALDKPFANKLSDHCPLRATLRVR